MSTGPRWYLLGVSGSYLLRGRSAHSGSWASSARVFCCNSQLVVEEKGSQCKIIIIYNKLNLQLCQEPVLIC